MGLLDSVQAGEHSDTVHEPRLAQDDSLAPGKHL